MEDTKTREDDAGAPATPRADAVAGALARRPGWGSHFYCRCHCKSPTTDDDRPDAREWKRNGICHHLCIMPHTS